MLEFRLIINAVYKQTPSCVLQWHVHEHNSSYLNYNRDIFKIHLFRVTNDIISAQMSIRSARQVISVKFNHPTLGLYEAIGCAYIMNYKCTLVKITNQYKQCFQPTERASAWLALLIECFKNIDWNTFAGPVLFLMRFGALRFNLVRFQVQRMACVATVISQTWKVYHFERAALQSFHDFEWHLTSFSLCL